MTTKQAIRLLPALLFPLLLITTLALGCTESVPTAVEEDAAPEAAAAAGAAAKNGPAHIDVKGLNIVVELSDPNPLETNFYRFHAKSINGEVKGKFRTQGEGPGGLFGDARGDIICVGVAPDGMTAWLGGFITHAEDNLEGFFPDFTGTWVIWSVAVTEDGSAFASTTSLGVPTEEIALDHCSTGFALPLQETTGMVQIRESESGFGLGPPAK